MYVWELLSFKNYNPVYQNSSVAQHHCNNDQHVVTSSAKIKKKKKVGFKSKIPVIIYYQLMALPEYSFTQIEMKMSWRF